MSKEKVMFLKTQFSYEDISEISPARFDEGQTIFVDHDLNIGCGLNLGNSRRPYKNTPARLLKEQNHRYDRLINKKCMGAIFCSNNECPFYKKEVRPPTDEKRIKQSKCMECRSPKKWNKCEVQVVCFTSATRI
jgi:hypothetical protein